MLHKMTHLLCFRMCNGSIATVADLLASEGCWLRESCFLETEFQERLCEKPG